LLIWSTQNQKFNTVKNLYLLLAALFMTITACNNEKKSTAMENPLLKEFNTPFGVPPFEEIKLEDFSPAILEAIKMHQSEIDAIVSNEEEPTFENTILPYENSGFYITQSQAVFGNLNSSLTSPEMQKIAQDLSPAISAHSDAIKLNQKLFDKIKFVYENRANFNLDSESTRLLQETYKSFVRGGADLNEDDKNKLRDINEQLSLLSLKFGENVLGDINDFKLVIESKDDLSGLPENVIYSAAENAKEAGMEGKWIFTVQKPSLLPFLTYVENRTLREKLFKAYTNLGNNNNEFDNKEIVKKISSLRAEKANLLGYATHADYILDNNMAKNPETVFNFLDKIWTPALKRASEEAADLQKMMNDKDKNLKLEPWDWWYYSEKVRKEKFDISEEEVSQYFVLDNVVKGVFGVAHKLYGINFEELNNLPVYQKDVKAYEVKDKDGSHLGILYMDFFPRASKRSGAWMSNFREQSIKEGVNIRPVVTTNFNFTKPTADAPALLTMDEVLTTFHEFGHALHSLLSQCTYESLSGTSVTRDFVELPSQVMENWGMEPEVLKTYAFHYKTGEVIPSNLIQKIKDSGHFNQGFVTTEYMAAAYLDMDFHTLNLGDSVDNVTVFEKDAMNSIGLIPEIVVRYRSTYFNHIFSGGYSSGYYSYLWAEQLDADAFDAFKETGDIFNQEVADSFRKNILEKGNTAEAKDLYFAFRGKQPGVESLLRKRGLDK
jgi:peptidyl-dipeptidase Dcp